MIRKSGVSFAALAYAASSLTLATAPAVAQDSNSPKVCAAFSEAPALAQKVSAGELPPAADRLPLNPLVVPTFGETGVYGGDFADLTAGGRIAEMRNFGYEPLVRWSVDGTEVIPGVAKGWDINESATKYTFHLREGMKWSDGKPFTAKDIKFWWDRIENNPKINAGGPHSIFVVKGEAAKVEVVDDYTFTLSWSQPYGMLLQHLAGPYGQRIVMFPEHYVSKFDIDLDPEGVAELMKKSGETNYTAWWKANVGSYSDAAQFNDPARPSLMAWVPKQSYLGKQRFSFERNPYYFKVDADCQQLPYMDTHTWTLATDDEVSLLQALQGNVSISGRNVSVPQNRAVFFDSQEQGDYRLINSRSCDFNTAIIWLSMNHPDPIKAKVFQNKDFRIGLSYAINRPEIIDVVYLGQGEPNQVAPLKDSPFYNEKLARQYTDFDMAKANEYLDKVLPKRNADGLRLGPDGKPFSFRVGVNADFKPDTVDAFQLVERTWREAGLDVTIDFRANELHDAYSNDPTRDAVVWVGENGCGQLPLLNLDRFINDSGSTQWGNWDAWRAWDYKRLGLPLEVAEGVNPVEPPANIARLYELRSEIPTKIGDEQAALMSEFMNLLADEFLAIGISTPAGFYRAVKNDVQGVPAELVEGWYYPGPAPANLEAWFHKAK